MSFPCTLPLTHEKIIEGCRKGDAVMQKELYDLYSGKFYMLCRRYSSSDASAQEVLSDGFLNVFAQIDKYRGDGSFEGWMRTIFLRCAIKRYKQDNQRMETSVEYDEETPVADVDHGTKLDVRQALLKSMRRLTIAESQAFNLVAVEGYKLEEASKMMDENLSTFKSRYYNALEKMREMLTGFLGEEYIRNRMKKDK